MASFPLQLRNILAKRIVGVHAIDISLLIIFLLEKLAEERPSVAEGALRLLLRSLILILHVDQGAAVLVHHVRLRGRVHVLRCGIVNF